MSLDTLSPEILLNIIKYVPIVIVLRGDSQFGDLLEELQIGRGAQHLARLARCSQRLNILTTPLLYEHYVTVAPLPQVLHRLLTKASPDLVTATKEFITPGLNGGSDLEPRIDLASLTAITQDDFTQCDEIIREIFPFDLRAANWGHKLREGSWDAYVALILTFLENLEHIDIVEYSEPHMIGVNLRFLDLIFNRAARLQEEGKLDERGSLSKLRNFRVAYSETEYGLSIDTILPFLKPRSIKEFLIHMLVDEAFEPAGNRFYTTDLKLQYSCVEGDCLVKFLSCFRDLKRFSYENGGSIVAYHEFLPQKVGEAVMHLKQSLEVLVVSDADGSDEEFMPLGCLAGFDKLEVIVTQSQFLLGGSRSDDEEDEDDDEDGQRKEWNLVDVLPKSIKKLGLSNCYSKEFGYVREILAHKEENFPFLEEVRFYYVDEYELDADEVYELENECKSARIKFVASVGHPGLIDNETFFT